MKLREEYIKSCKLIKRYNITLVKAKRAINSIGSRRGNVDEVVVRNYE